ncbi:hypothetical protein Dsin_005281 [Dipteronia sinensis]|uniref:RING-type domain-containing protein n=1 Tax=Dipteronia sinensis TaxID=43782 RepID=A0AAE0AXH4_9ROSI|nr:hypothetical protein Dsin_005281 [Dipteronia sinensis]
MGHPIVNRRLLRLLFLPVLFSPSTKFSLSNIHGPVNLAAAFIALMDVVPLCSCCQFPSCSSSPSPSPAPPLVSVMGTFDFHGPTLFHTIPKFISGAISGTLTGLFALAGAFTGAVTGALAGRASECGVLRGAGLGAIAGAVLSVEVLEASRAYWCLERSGSRGSSSMADFVEELLCGRLVDEQFTPSLLTAYRWQVSIANMSYDVNVTYGPAVSRGLSGESLKKLPCHVILDEIKATHSICCSICLQDIEVGELARSLPRCNHTFHLACVDKWLNGHGSCPVCRQDV